MAKVCCLLLLGVVFLQYCGAINVCGLGDIPKVSLANTNSIENLVLAVIKWSVTPNGKGYFQIPLDPLNLKDVSFTVNDDRFILKNVRVSGVLDSDVKISKIGSNFRFLYTYNLLLEADGYVKITLRNNDEYTFEEPVKVEISNVVTEHHTSMGFIERCDGSKYIELKNTNLETRSGVSNIVSGPSELTKDNIGDFTQSLVETIGKAATEAINKNIRQLHSIVPAKEFILDENSDPRRVGPPRPAPV